MASCERCGRERVWRRDVRREAGGYWRCPTRTHDVGASRAGGMIVLDRPKRGKRPVAVLCVDGRASRFYYFA